MYANECLQLLIFLYAYNVADYSCVSGKMFMLSNMTIFFF